MITSEVTGTLLNHNWRDAADAVAYATQVYASTPRSARNIFESFSNNILGEFFIPASDSVRNMIQHGGWDNFAVTSDIMSSNRNFKWFRIVHVGGRTRLISGRFQVDGRLNDVAGLIDCYIENTYKIIIPANKRFVKSAVCGLEGSVATADKAYWSKRWMRDPKIVKIQAGKGKGVYAIFEIDSVRSERGGLIKARLGRLLKIGED